MNRFPIPTVPVPGGEPEYSAMARRMAASRQRLATDHQAEIDREAREASSAAVMGAVADLDGMCG